MLAHRSCRSFEQKPIDDDLLKLLFACALSAPSKSDLQQTDIIHVSDSARRRAVEALIPSMPWIAEAPVFLLFCGNNRRLRQVSEKHEIPFTNDHLDAFFNAAVDAGIVMMAFIEAAEAVGLGCCPISAVRNHPRKLDTLLKLPEWVFPVAGLCVGYPESEGRLSYRLPLEVTVHTDAFDETELETRIDAYDRRRAAAQPISNQKETDRFGESEFYGWSEDKARQYSVSQRSDFGAYIRAKGFNLE
jgi:nitroreductase/FMN reductase [NAD(P)H]